jgi:hypothetical protein
MAPNNQEKNEFFWIFFANCVFTEFFLLIRIENVLFSRTDIFELGKKIFFSKKSKKIDFSTEKLQRLGNFFFGNFFLCG